jgi:two-component system, NarL family, sensor histidine kinase DesK
MGAAVLIRKRRWRRWSELTRVERVGLYTRQSLYLMLVGFNASVLIAAANQDDDTPAAALVGGFAVTAFAFPAFATLLRRFPAIHPLPWRRLTPLFVASAALLAVAVAAWSDEIQLTAALIVGASVTAVLALVPGQVIVVGLLLGCSVLLGVAGGEPVNFAAGLFVGGLFVFTIRASLWLLGIVQDLDEASHAKAELAVMEERLRFSRDVHDVLGRQLSTIAVRAELAATLAARGDEQAAERMLEVRAVAHEALREARELARGYRSTDFLNELEGARSLLRSAGIEVQLRVDDMPRAWHEAAGWVVRESVTNVLRHSSASVVEISFADGRLRVDNDGARGGGSADGSGLRGLRERLSPLGASLEARPESGDRWAVVARLPGSGPLSATNKEGSSR